MALIATRQLAMFVKLVANGCCSSNIRFNCGNIIRRGRSGRAEYILKKPYTADDRRGLNSVLTDRANSQFYRALRENLDNQFKNIEKMTLY